MNEKLSQYITTIKTHKWSPIERILIRKLSNLVLKSPLANNYNFTYKTQKYSIQYIISHIILFIYTCKKWRDLGDKWNNIYKHYIKLNDANFFEDSYKKMLQRYFKRTKYAGLKFVYTDTSFIYNKTGVDCMERNKFAKNKNCNKLHIICDKNKIPLDISIKRGNEHDAKILKSRLNVITPFCPHIKYFMADSGYCGKYIRQYFNDLNIKTLIPFNMRNNKKYTQTNKMNWKDKKQVLLKDFTDKDKQLYKKRIHVENLFCEIKQITRVSLRFDKYVKNMYGILYIFASKKLVPFLNNQ